MQNLYLLQPRQRCGDSSTQTLHAPISITITPPPLPVGASLHCDGGKSYVVVKFRDATASRADPSPCLDKQDAAEKIGLHVEAIEAAHVARRINAAKMRAGQGRAIDDNHRAFKSSLILRGAAGVRVVSKRFYRAIPLRLEYSLWSMSGIRCKSTN